MFLVPVAAVMKRRTVMAMAAGLGLLLVVGLGWSIVSDSGSVKPNSPTQEDDSRFPP